MYTEELGTGRLAYEVLSQYLLENDRPGKARWPGKAWETWDLSDISERSRNTK